jgi:hypothetical protein
VNGTAGATVSVTGTPTPEPTDGDDDTGDTDGGSETTEPFTYDVAVDDGVTTLELADATANRRYDVDLGTSITAGGTTVTAAEIFFDRSVEEGTVRFDATETEPDDAVELSGAMAYLSADADGVEDDRVAEVELEFTVSESTLDDRGVSPENVRLYRFDGETWVAHETTHEGGARFTVENVPSFGVFAVGPAGAAAVTESPTPTPTPTAEPTTTAVTTTVVETTEPAETTSVETPTSTPAQTSQPQTETTSTAFPGFGPVAVLAALVVTTVVAARASRRR